jgi:hypothetical protein
MPPLSSKSLDSLQQRMQDVDPHSFRYKVMEDSKNFKTSWIELGRSLYTVWKDKLFKSWGYGTFEAYTVKEIGIRTNTAMKLLRSYYFLEKEEPALLKKEYAQDHDPVAVPSYEAVDVLRSAKSKRLDEDDYSSLKKQVFEQGKDALEVRKDLTSMIRQRQELEPEEAWEKRKAATVRRFLGTLKSLHQELESAKLVSSNVLKKAALLIHELEGELH